MRVLLALLVFGAVLLAACGGGDDPSGDFVGLGSEPSTASRSDASADEPDGDATATGGGSGTLDNPTPEASGDLPPDGFRIGSDVWIRTVPITRGQCFVQEGEGITPFAVWGTLDNDDALSFAVSHDADAGFSSEVSSDTMFWVAGQREGSELTVEHDVATQSISGEGLFYNLHSDEWAHGSFQFTCTGA